ncbi:PadR family transcriptional regulator [Rhizobium sp. BR 362]|uniref:PadR family transcriptional regulator n=1 Tax=Rhizobium sp. BR 362 TaxID=3040670 RepID=UPI002F408D47
MPAEKNHSQQTSSRRVLDSEELGLLLMLLIEGTDGRHGYDLIKEIKNRSGAIYAPSSGIVYPRLTILVETGYLAASSPEEQRRTYELTAAGEGYLEVNRSEAQGVLARIEAMRFRGGGVTAGPVGRAMQNLKTALGQTLSGEPSRQLQLDVAEIIDDAVRRIERL